MNNENYATIQGWMVNELGLNGDRLIVFAVIYGFSQDGQSMYTAGNRYLREWTGKTDDTVRKVLKSLEEDGLIIRHEVTLNGVQFNHYQVNFSDFSEGVQNSGTPRKIRVPPPKNCGGSYNGSMLYNSSNNKYKYKNKGGNPLLSPFGKSGRNGTGQINAGVGVAVPRQIGATEYNDSTI